MSILDNTQCRTVGSMRNFTSADAKNQFGELVDSARVAPVAITKYGRPFVVALAVEEFERLKALDASAAKRKVKD